MTVKDYYRLLGVGRESTDEEIKKAYRKLAMMYHPDRNAGDPDCEDHLKEINEAYQVLGDQEKRRQYDFLRRQPLRGRAFYEGDPSNELFSILRAFARGGFPRRSQGGCGGRGFGRRGCRRWNRNF